MDFGDVKHYWRAAQHKTMEKSAKNTYKVDIFYTSTASNETNDSVIKPKVRHTNFIVQHNFLF